MAGADLVLEVIVLALSAAAVWIFSGYRLSFGLFCPLDTPPSGRSGEKGRSYEHFTNETFSSFRRGLSDWNVDARARGGADGDVVGGSAGHGSGGARSTGVSGWYGPVSGGGSYPHGFQSNEGNADVNAFQGFPLSQSVKTCSDKNGPTNHYQDTFLKPHVNYSYRDNECWHCKILPAQKTPAPCSGSAFNSVYPEHIDDKNPYFISRDAGFYSNAADTLGKDHQLESSFLDCRNTDPKYCYCCRHHHHNYPGRLYQTDSLTSPSLSGKETDRHAESTCLTCQFRESSHSSQQAGQATGNAFSCGFHPRLRAPLENPSYTGVDDQRDTGRRVGIQAVNPGPFIRDHRMSKVSAPEVDDIQTVIVRRTGLPPGTDCAEDSQYVTKILLKANDEEHGRKCMSLPQTVIGTPSKAEARRSNAKEMTAIYDQDKEKKSFFTKTDTSMRQEKRPVLASELPKRGDATKTSDKLGQFKSRTGQADLDSPARRHAQAWNREHKRTIKAGFSDSANHLIFPRSSDPTGRPRSWAPVGNSSSSSSSCLSASSTQQLIGPALFQPKKNSYLYNM